MSLMIMTDDVFDVAGSLQYENIRYKDYIPQIRSSLSPRTSKWQEEQNSDSKLQLVGEVLRYKLGQMERVVMFLI